MLRAQLCFVPVVGDPVTPYKLNPRPEIGLFAGADCCIVDKEVGSQLSFGHVVKELQSHVPLPALPSLNPMQIQTDCFNVLPTEPINLKS